MRSTYFLIPKKSIGFHEAPFSRALWVAPLLALRETVPNGCKKWILIESHQEARATFCWEPE